MDPTPVVAGELWAKNWPYWRYTRDVAERLYGPDAHDFIAFTNLIKCTNVGGEAGSTSAADTTSYRMVQCCVAELGVIWKEIELLRPFNLVFYSYSLFRDVLRSIPVAEEGSLREITPEGNFVMCRNKRLHWWDRTCRTLWTDNLRILVTGHPERMGRNEYVHLLSTWLKSGPPINPAGPAER